jgi:serine/threonine-protein kinase CLA4
MAFNPVSATSLTPTRPAPAAPNRDVQNVLASSGYTSFSMGPPSPSGSYSSSYTGVGGSPDRSSDSMSSTIVRSGVVSIKEDGLVSWLWRPKWLILKETTLSIHKSEVRGFCLLFFLKDAGIILD